MSRKKILLITSIVLIIFTTIAVTILTNNTTTGNLSLNNSPSEPVTEFPSDANSQTPTEICSTANETFDSKKATELMLTCAFATTYDGKVGLIPELHKDVIAADMVINPAADHSYTGKIKQYFISSWSQSFLGENGMLYTDYDFNKELQTASDCIIQERMTALFDLNKTEPFLWVSTSYSGALWDARTILLKSGKLMAFDSNYTLIEISLDELKNNEKIIYITSDMALTDAGNVYNISPVKAKLIPRTELNNIAAIYENIIITTNGNILLSVAGRISPVTIPWSNIISARYNSYYLYGLQSDGTVLEYDFSTNRTSKVFFDSDYIAITEFGNSVAGLTSDGHVSIMMR